MCLSSVKAKLEEDEPERVEPFQKGASDAVKALLKDFKNYQVTVSRCGSLIPLRPSSLWKCTWTNAYGDGTKYIALLHSAGPHLLRCSVAVKFIGYKESGIKLRKPGKSKNCTGPCAYLLA